MLSATLQLKLARQYGSAAAEDTVMSRQPAVTAISRPFRLGTIAERMRLAWEPPSNVNTAVVSASCGTQRGEMKAPTSTSRRPAISSSSTRFIRTIGSRAFTWLCRPRRAPTSMMRTRSRPVLLASIIAASACAMLAER